MILFNSIFATYRVYTGWFKSWICIIEVLLIHVVDTVHGSDGDEPIDSFLVVLIILGHGVQHLWSALRKTDVSQLLKARFFKNFFEESRLIMQTHCIPAKVPSLLFRPASIFVFVIDVTVAGPSVVWHPDIVSSVHQLKRPSNRIMSKTFFYKMLSITEFTMLHKHGVLSIIHAFSCIFACNSEHWQIPAIVRLDLVGLPSVPYLFH